MITKEMLNDIHGSLCSEALNLMQLKNKDYGATTDALKNFRESESMGLTIPQGIMIRISDKWGRLKTFMREGSLSVKGESVHDSIVDIINYLVILQASLNEKQKEGES